MGCQAGPGGARRGWHGAAAAAGSFLALSTLAFPSHPPTHPCTQLVHDPIWVRTADVPTAPGHALPGHRGDAQPRHRGARRGAGAGRGGAGRGKDGGGAALRHVHVRLLNSREVPAPPSLRSRPRPQLPSRPHRPGTHAGARGQGGRVCHVPVARLRPRGAQGGQLLLLPPPRGRCAPLACACFYSSSQGDGRGRGRAAPGPCPCCPLAPAPTSAPAAPPAPAAAAAVTLGGAGGDSVLSEGELVYLWSEHPEDENSFDKPAQGTCGGAGSWVRKRGMRGLFGGRLVCSMR